MNTKTLQDIRLGINNLSVKLEQLYSGLQVVEECASVNEDAMYSLLAMAESFVMEIEGDAASIMDLCYTAQNEG